MAESSSLHAVIHWRAALSMASSSRTPPHTTSEGETGGRSVTGTARATAVHSKNIRIRARLFQSECIGSPAGGPASLRVRREDLRQRAGPICAVRYKTDSLIWNKMLSATSKKIHRITREGKLRQISSAALRKVAAHSPGIFPGSAASG